MSWHKFDAAKTGDRRHGVDIYWSCRIAPPLPSPRPATRNFWQGCQTPTTRIHHRPPITSRPTRLRIDEEDLRLLRGVHKIVIKADILWTDDTGLSDWCFTTTWQCCWTGESVLGLDKISVQITICRLRHDNNGESYLSSHGSASSFFELAVCTG